MKIATVSPMLASRPAILMSFPMTLGGAGAPIASVSAFPPTTPINLPIIRLPATIQVIAPVYVPRVHKPLYETRQLQACGLDQNVKLFVEACVGACPAKSSVNSTLLTHNCTSIPAPCVECMAPLLAGDVSLEQA